MPTKNTSLPPFDSPEYREIINQWLKNERLVAAVDAFVQGYGNVFDAGHRAFDEWPAKMIASDFINIVADIANRLEEIENLGEIRRKYPSFYRAPSSN